MIDCQPWSAKRWSLSMTINTHLNNVGRWMQRDSLSHVPIVMHLLHFFSLWIMFLVLHVKFKVIEFLFYHRNFIVLIHMFISISHFKLIFAYVVQEGSKFTFNSCLLNCYRTIHWKHYVLYSLIWRGIFLENQLTTYVWVYFGSSSLFH